MKIPLCLMIAVCALSAQAATYSSNGAAFDSGLARSQNGAVAHCGVLGSWLRSPSQSANYVNQPGPALPPIIMPEASVPIPWLTITSVGGNVRVSWPSWATDYLLIESDDLASSSSWMKVAAPYQSSLTEIYVEVPPVGQRFYRLVYSP